MVRLAVGAPRMVYRGGIYEHFHKPLQERRWEGAATEVMVEGGTGTGKGVSLGTYYRNKLRMFPGMHLLVVRRFKADLPASWMQTWEDEVLDPSDPWDAYMLDGPGRSNRTSYEYPNGSVVWVRGMDQWSRFKSSAFDDVWANEGTELKEEHIEGLHTRIRPRRGVRVPRRQLVYDVNPEHPGHWANQRALRGVSQRVTTTIRDNPGYWDTKNDCPTEEGREYIERLLKGLEGHNLQRAWFCRWVAATGVILSSFTNDTHTFSGRIVSRQYGLDELHIDQPHPLLPPVVNIGWYVASIDWGRRHAGTLQVWAVDEEGRQFLVEEYYHSERGLLWWAQIAADVVRRFGTGPGCTLKAIVADNAEPNYIELMNDALFDLVGPHSRVVEKCKKATRGDSMSNMEILRSSFEGDHPRIFMSRTALQHAPDMRLPVRRLVEEIPGWVYAEYNESRARGRPKDMPDEGCTDDGLDAATYASVYIFGGRRDFTPSLGGVQPVHHASAARFESQAGWKPWERIRHATVG